MSFQKAREPVSLCPCPQRILLNTIFPCYTWIRVLLDSDHGQVILLEFPHLSSKKNMPQSCKIKNIAYIKTLYMHKRIKSSSTGCSSPLPTASLHRYRLFPPPPTSLRNLCTSPLLGVTQVSRGSLAVQSPFTKPPLPSPGVSVPHSSLSHPTEGFYLTTNLFPI